MNIGSAKSNRFRTRPAPFPKRFIRRKVYCLFGGIHLSGLSLSLSLSGGALLIKVEEPFQDFFVG